LAVKLTDEQLRDYSRGISAHPAGAAMMADELIALRELLATPTDPAGMEQPEIVPIVDGTHAVAWASKTTATCSRLKLSELVRR
jgi:hypothetical protein